MRLLLLPFLLLTLLAPRLSAQAIATIRPGDMFELRLGGMDGTFAQDVNGQYSVGQEGTVNIPFIGELRAVGLTPQQLQTVMQNKFITDKIFTHPTVNINLMQNVRMVSVGGGVRAPQRYQWTPDLTLVSSIYNAGGLSEWGSMKGVKLIRDQKVQIFDARKFEKDPSLDPKLLPGDQVIVPGP